MTAEVKKLPSASPAARIELCSNGDLTLLISKEHRPATHRINVSRMSMCLASPVWRAMLTGRFAEATKDEILLVDDDPEALLTVLRVAHLRFYEVPKFINLQQLLQIAMLCDKYDTVAICRPFIAGWTAPWFQNIQSNSRSPLSEDLYPTAGNDSLLTIAWVFGYQEHFVKRANNLLLSVVTDAEGSCLFQNSRYYGVLIQNMTPGITKSLLKIRKETVGAMLEIFYKYLGEVLNRKSCKFQITSSCDSWGYRIPNSNYGNPNSDCCYALALGTLVDAFRPIGDIGLHRSRPIILNTSVQTVYDTLSGIKLPAWRDEPYDHQHCDFTAEMKDAIRSVYLAMPSPVLDSHLVYTRTQGMKGQTRG